MSSSPTPPKTTTFDDLPLELLPLILRPLLGRRSDLRSAALVCRTWREPAERVLYSWIRLWGRDLAIAPLVFYTLAEHPKLCGMIHKLEVRVFSLSLILKERLEMNDLAAKVLRQCTNLRELVWTRKGALTDSVFEAITSLPHLRSFEFNAHTALSPGSWDADHLLSLPRLEKISFIMPDRNIASILPRFFERQRSLSSSATANPESARLEMRELTILCRESPNISDNSISRIADHLKGSSLQSLALAGCSKLTGSTLLPLLSDLPNLQFLALEATAIPPSFYVAAKSHLTQLKSLKLTHPGPRHPLVNQFFPSISELLESLDQLESFTLYHSGTTNSGQLEWPTIENVFMDVLVEKKRLRKFECSGVLINLDQLEVLAEVQNLKYLVIHLGWDLNLERISRAISLLPNLKTLHILSQSPARTVAEVKEIASSSQSLVQIGFRNRVWHIRRTLNLVKSENGSGTQEAQKVTLREGVEAFGAFRRGRYGAEEDAEEVEED